MDLQIIKEKEEALLGRKVLTLDAKYTGESTPKKEGLVKDVAKLAKAPEELVVIEKVDQKYGEGAVVTVSIYKDAGSLKRFKKRKGKKEKKKKKKKKEEKK